MKQMVYLLNSGDSFDQDFNLQISSEILFLINFSDKKEIDLNLKITHAKNNIKSRILIGGIIFKPHKLSIKTFSMAADKIQRGEQSIEIKMLNLNPLPNSFSFKPQNTILGAKFVCHHGAAVNGLDATEIEYLENQGLDKHQAKNLLIKAFYTDLINQIRDKKTKDTIINNFKYEFN